MRRLCWHIVLIVWGVLALVGCSQIAASDSSFSAYDAPCGNPVLGATLGDGWTGLCEVPAPVLVSGGWTDSVSVTPDGLSLYFGYSRTDFGQFMDSNGVTRNPTGPLRTGMSGSAFKMFRADLSISGWSIQYLPFNGNSAVDEASASANAAGTAVVFSRFDGSGVASLYYTTLSGSTWATPVAFPTAPAINTTNTSCTNDNAFIVGTVTGGFTLYFESNRNDLAGTACRGDGKNRLYFVTYNSMTGFSSPQAVPGLDAGAVNENDVQISLTQDKQTVYFTRSTNTAYGIFTGTWNGASFTGVHQIVTPNFAGPFTGTLGLIGEANVAITSKGSLLYMMCGIAQSEANAHDPAIRVCFAKKPN
jgi:hypothetical protein